MKTILTTDPIKAAEFVRAGGIVAFPTETVYGLGANVFDEAAIARVFEAKRRPADNPLIAHIARLEQVAELASGVQPHARLLIDAFFPGPLTVVLSRMSKVPDIATAGLDTIGIRMPRNEIARGFVEACGTPLVAPSANLSGRPSPTTWQAAMEDLDGRIDCILQGDPTEIGLESTVVDCTGDVPELLRQGAVSLDDLLAIVPITRVSTDPAVGEARSPGLRHKHYSPAARVVLIDDPEEIEDPKGSAFIGLVDPPAGLATVRVCKSSDEYAHELFEFFRECDRRRIATIYCETVDRTGIGAALMDRLERAATGSNK